MFEFKCEEKDRVIVRIWTSKFNKIHVGDDIGHVSIEIPSLTMKNPKYNKNDQNSKKEIPFYASLWPKEGIKLGGSGNIKPVAPEFHLDYQTDLEAETGNRRPDGIPELTICLYSLKPRSIKNEFDNICSGKDVKVGIFKKEEKEFKGWVLIGGNRLINRNSGESCSSLAYKLLKAGGIYDLISTGYSSKFSSVVSPDDLSKAVISARRYELKKYPETQEFIYKGESSLEDIKKSKVKNCVVM